MTHQPYDPFYLHQIPPPQDFAYADRSINTLFISGLPDDIKAREIHNLFRRRPGFDSCQLKYTGRGDQVVAFATFFNHQSAIAALHALNFVEVFQFNSQNTVNLSETWASVRNAFPIGPSLLDAPGVKFDPQTGSTLHIELARSNSRRKRKPGGGAYVVIDKRTKTAANAQETSSDDGDSESDEPSGTDNPDSGNNNDLATAKSGETVVDPDSAVAAAVNEQPEKTDEGGVPPCSTLFIANLGPNCTEDELKQTLCQYPGFNMLKMRARGGMPVAFADFEDIEQANKVMEELQGSMLASSDRGGMHIEYARSKMRKR